MQFRHNCTIGLLFLLIPCFFWSCGDKKEETKAPVISKKISAQDIPKPLKTDTLSNTPDSKDTGEEEVIEEKRIYDPKIRIDPFLPLFRAEKKEVPADQADKTKKMKRIPQTPLEKIGLNQLKLTAIIRASSGNRGLVEDASGKGYIIKKGTYVGLNSGIVTQINAQSVIVEEELENLMGKRVLQNTEIKLQKPAGE
jgi:type IV pilus assembly protein PilP